jgi:hypothetical protein
MSLIIRVRLEDMVSGLDWDAVFAGTFPDRRFHALEHEEGDPIIVHRCSAAMESLFFPRDDDRSPEVAQLVRESLPELLKRGEDEDEELDEDDDGEELDDGLDEDDEDDDDDDGDDEQDDEDVDLDDEVYADDFVPYTTKLLELTAASPGARVGSTTIGALKPELLALLTLMRLAQENALDVTWTPA